MDDCLTTVSKIPQLREIPPLHFGEVTSKDDSKDDSIEYVRLNYAADIHKLIHIPKQDQLRRIDATIAPIDDRIRSATPGLVPYLPGVLFDTFKMSGDIGESEFSRYSTPEEQTFIPQFISLYQRLGELCNHADRVQYCMESSPHYLIESLVELKYSTDRAGSLIRQRHLMERQLCRLQDLRDGGGFGFSVELFFLALAKLLSTVSSRDTHSTLFSGTCIAVTSDWRQHKHSIGTQRLILHLICDVAIPDRGVFSNRGYPRHITDQLLVLLKNMVEGQSGSHIDDAVKELDAVPQSSQEGRLFRAEAIRVISRRRAPVPSL